MVKKRPCLKVKGINDAWEKFSLKNIFVFKYGEFNNNPDNGGQYPIYGANGIIGGYDRFNAENSIIIGHMGEYAGSVIYEKNKHFVTYNGTITTRKDKQPIQSYDYYLLSSLGINKICNSSGLPFLSYDKLNEIEVFDTSSLFEKDKIGRVLTSVENLVTFHLQKCKKLVATKEALFEKIFPKKESNVPQLRFKGYESPWQKKTLGKIGTTYTGLSGKTKDDFGHGEARFVTYVNVFKNPIADIKGVDFVEIDASQNIVKNGDVLFTTSSETPEEVGMSSVWLGDTENTYLNSFCFGYRLFSSEKIDPLYLAYLLRSPEIRKEFKFLAQGISRYNISKTKVMDIVISVPEDYEEQVKIGKLFFNLDKLIELTQKKYEKLESLKKAMLNKMFV